MTETRSPLGRAVEAIGGLFRRLADFVSGRSARDARRERQRRGRQPRLPARRSSARVRQLRQRRDGAAPPRTGGAAEVAAAAGLPGLARVLAHPDPAARRLALDTIGEFAPARAGALIAELVHDSDPTVRCAAAQAAARARASSAVLALILALVDSEPEVRRAAKEAIESITGEKIAVDPAAALGEAELEQLKGWWKQRRLAQLMAESAR